MLHIFCFLSVNTYYLRLCTDLEYTFMAISLAQIAASKRAWTSPPPESYDFSVNDTTRIVKAEISGTEDIRELRGQ